MAAGLEGVKRGLTSSRRPLITPYIYLGHQIIGPRHIGSATHLSRKAPSKPSKNQLVWVRTTWFGRNHLVKATNHLASSYQAL
jgi:hypothetical protein